MTPELEFVTVVASSIGSAVLAVLHDRRRLSKNGNGNGAHAHEMALEFAKHVADDERWHGRIDAELSSVGRSLDEIKAWLLRVETQINARPRRR